MAEIDYNNLCCICLDNIPLHKQQPNICHLLCKDCFKKVIKRNPICPICKTDLPLTKKQIKAKLTKFFNKYYKYSHIFHINYYCETIIYKLLKPPINPPISGKLRDRITPFCFMVYNVSTNYMLLSINELKKLYSINYRSESNSLIRMLIFSAIKEKIKEHINLDRHFCIGFVNGEIVIRF